MAAAQAVVEQYRDPNQPIGVTIPLTGKPEPKKFAWLECELESCPYITVGVEAATKALGWEMIKITSESANPGPAFQQAIDAGVDFIASSGEARALYEEQAAAAKDEGHQDPELLRHRATSRRRDQHLHAVRRHHVRREDRAVDGGLGDRRLGGLGATC